MHPIATPRSEQRRIVVADADRRVRESLAGLCDLMPGIAVVATTGRAAEVAELVDATSAEIVVVDPAIPEEADGLTVIATLRERFPRLRIVAMSCSSRVEDAALHAGADRFLAKGASGRSFVEEIVAVIGDREGVRRAGPPEGEAIAAAGMADSLDASGAGAPASPEGGLEDSSDGRSGD